MFPAARKRSALKKAWVTKWNIPAASAPTATAKIMYPIWLMVEYARMRLMSNWTQAISAAISAVATPIAAAVPALQGACAKTG
jgi:hypothetical protein